MTIKTTMMACLLGVAIQSHAESCYHFQDVPERSDKDFRVQWSACDPIDVYERVNGDLRLQRHYPYSTDVGGKGKLSQLQLLPNGGALITVVGLQSHHQWKAFINVAGTSSEGVSFWKVGDVIELATSTILWDDKRIPDLLQGTGSENITAHCGQSGCYILTKKGSVRRP